MKKIFYLSTALLAALSLNACQEEGKKAIEFDSLPETAKELVNTHFADKQVAAVYRDHEVTDKDYEVIFTDGANIDFTKKGEWDEVEDRDADGVPEAIIPQAIREYVNEKHTGQYVVQIGKERKEYEVELNSSIEITFDKNGKFVRYDD